MIVFISLFLRVHDIYSEMGFANVVSYIYRVCYCSFRISDLVCLALKNFAVVNALLNGYLYTVSTEIADLDID